MNRRQPSTASELNAYLKGQSIVTELEPVELGLFGLPPEALPLIPGEVLDVDPVHEARTNLVFVVTTTAGTYYVKRYRPNRLITALPAKHRAQVEMNALKILEKGGLLAPRLVAAGPMVAVTAAVGDSRSVAVPLSRREIYGIVAWLGHLHNLSLDPNWAKDAADHLALRAAVALAQMRATEESGGTDFQPALELLRQFPDPYARRTSMLQGDPNLENWRIRPDGTVIAFDFEFASTGSPSADVGMFLVDILVSYRFSTTAWEAASYALLAYRELTGTRDVLLLTHAAVAKLTLAALAVADTAEAKRLLDHLPGIAAWAEEVSRST